MNDWELWVGGVRRQGAAGISSCERNKSETPLTFFFFLLNHQFCVIYSKDRTVIYMFSRFEALNHLIGKRSITKSLLVYLICPLAHGSVSPCRLTSKIFHKKLQNILHSK